MLHQRTYFRIDLPNSGVDICDVLRYNYFVHNDVSFRIVVRLTQLRRKIFAMDLLFYNCNLILQRVDLFLTVP